MSSNEFFEQEDKKKPKGKRPAFLFYTGDWMKDPELRFCSIFARGLLVDLLCWMYESKKKGYLVDGKGKARSLEQIAMAVNGGEQKEKLAALEELITNNVLSVDENGVLYSRRIVRDAEHQAEISDKRSEAGSKGGKKTAANRAAKKQQTPQQGEQQTGQQNSSLSIASSSSIENTKDIEGSAPEVFEEEPEDTSEPEPTAKGEVLIGEWGISSPVSLQSDPRYGKEFPPVEFRAKGDRYVYLTRTGYDKLQSMYPKKLIANEIKAAALWTFSNLKTAKAKTVGGIYRFVTNWLEKSAAKLPDKPEPPKPYKSY